MQFLQSNSKLNISNAKISRLKTKIYNGTKQTQNVTVTYGSTVLKNNVTLMDKLKNMCKQYKDYKFCVICSNIENTQISFSASPLMKELKEYDNYMIFEEISDIKLVATTMKQQREEKKTLNPGDGFLVLNGKMERIRTILKD